MVKETKSKKNKSKITTADLKHEVFTLLKKSPKKYFDAKQIAKKIKGATSKEAVQNILQELVKEVKVIYFKESETYRVSREALAEDKQIVEGVLEITRRGAGYVVCEGVKKDIHIEAQYLLNALDGDTVQVAFLPRKSGTPEGEILKVIKRANEIFIGIIKLSKQFAFVVPDKLNMPVDIYVELKNTKNAKDGEKVVVQVEKWHGEEKHIKNPIGVVTAVLGEPGTSDIEMKAILVAAGFPLEFPPTVVQEMKHIEELITPTEIKRRRDFRGITTFTIDPETAKDFDDALSLKKLENGNWEVGVHIADVAHYVLPDTALDKEALKRSTSVYLVDRVLPMLPEKLSNELCSLRPNEDKLTFSAVFELDEKGKIVQEWFGRTVIHSNRRFTYEEAQTRIETQEGDFAIEINILNDLAHKLRKERFKHGSINFESPEVRFVLDEHGKPLRVYVKERKEAHLLVEDFMLLANKRVGYYMFHHETTKNEAKIPYIYRVHDTPNMDKVEEFIKFARGLGYKIIAQSPENVAKAFAKLLKEAEGKPEVDMLQQLAIRTMAKAVYSTENIGHYGLAFETYTHFTSPIRRYSDVLAHRILAKNLNGKTYRADLNDLTEQCKHISLQERKAADAERESIKYKQVEYMQDFVGQTFTGVISGLIERGLFVSLLENYCEGMIVFSDMTDDYYELIPGEYAAAGRKHGKRLRMGDEIKVKIISTNLAKRQIEMQRIF